MPQSLTILTHVVHYDWQGALYAYTPYVREIEVWARLFRQINLAAPRRVSPPPPDCSRLDSPNLRLLPQLERGGNTWRAKLWQIVSLPGLVWGVIQAIRQAEALQVRCPGNLGLLGVLLGPLFSPYRVAKYAGQWNSYPGEAFTYRLQRFLLRSRWWKAPALVYGNWPGQPAHILPFFTSVLGKAQVQQAEESAQGKTLHSPVRILYVGRLSPQKNVHILLQALAEIQSEGTALECRIVGEGQQRDRLQALRNAMPLPEQVHLLGGLSFDETLRQYEWADVLVLVSETEGWPKAIAEAMTFGALCIGSRRGLVPQMLAGERGLLAEPGDIASLVRALRQVTQGQIDFDGYSRRASAWGRLYSLESLEAALRDALEREWQVKL